MAPAKWEDWAARAPRFPSQSVSLGSGVLIKREVCVDGFMMNEVKGL